MNENILQQKRELLIAQIQSMNINAIYDLLTIRSVYNRTNHVHPVISTSALDKYGRRPRF